MAIFAIVNEVFCGGKVVGEEDRWNAACEQLFEMVYPSATIKASVVVHFFATKYLDARRVNQVEVADQVSRGHAVVRNQAVCGGLAGDPFETNVIDVVIYKVLHRQHSGSRVVRRCRPDRIRLGQLSKVVAQHLGRFLSAGACAELHRRDVEQLLPVYRDVVAFQLRAQ